MRKGPSPYTIAGVVAALLITCVVQLMPGCNQAPTPQTQPAAQYAGSAR